MLKFYVLPAKEAFTEGLNVLVFLTDKVTLLIYMLYHAFLIVVAPS